MSATQRQNPEKDRIGRTGGREKFLGIKDTPAGIKAVITDDAPVYNEKTYNFKEKEDGSYIFSGGRKRCSGGYRDITPNQRLIELLEERGFTARLNPA